MILLTKLLEDRFLSYHIKERPEAMQSNIQQDITGNFDTNPEAEKEMIKGFTSFWYC
jgi:hypothetical protein